MNFELPTITGIVVLSFILGGFLMHLLKRRKIRNLKEELLAYKRSADGLWELNEERLKKNKRKNENFGDNSSSDQSSLPSENETTSNSFIRIQKLTTKSELGELK